jgi:DNA modification methylase
LGRGGSGRMVIEGDVLELLRDFESDSFDAVLTDPPYGLSFQKAAWDASAPSVEVWGEVLRVLKPGAFGFVACGTRTQHRMASRLEDAGFEVRDVFAWIHSQGFAKGRDISKAVDKRLGFEREVVGVRKGRVGTAGRGEGVYIAPKGEGEGGTAGSARGFAWPGEYEVSRPASDLAARWEGYDTVLKPSLEFWTLVRKPMSEGTVADHVIKHDVGGIRVRGERWVGNVAHDGSDEVVGAFPGGASGFFYCPKARGRERLGHPTQKPVALTAHLAGILLPPGEMRHVLVPFCGVGSEMVGAFRAGWSRVTGIEIDAEYARVARRRVMMERVEG